jgi:hypothetical protein
MNMAKDGPIVTFVVSPHHSSAIIITAKDIRSLPLKKLHCEKVDEEAIKYLVGQEAVTRGSDETRFSRTRQFQTLLKWLWTVAVEPVLQSLGFLEDNDLLPSVLPRIWWVASGLMGVMPLHAAGTHTQGSRENTLSRVISSYAPTLKSLRYFQQILTNTKRVPEPSVMVVAMSKTKDRPSLVVEPEISLVETAFPRTTVLRNPTEATTLECMQTCNIGHFICHEYSDPRDPSQSGLLLSSGILTLEKLSQHYYPNAHIMYLSACSTAETSTEKLADEVLHLGSGFQLAGFPHVIGTLWEVNDKEAAEVASEFYVKIKGNGEIYLEEGVVARALHHSVMKQRDKLLDDPLAWAAQVHFGP